MHGLRATNESHRGKSKSPSFNRLFGSLFQKLCPGQSEVIIRAEVEVFLSGNRYLAPLCRLQHALNLARAVFLRGREFGFKYGLKVAVHTAYPFTLNIIFGFSLIAFSKLSGVNLYIGRAHVSTPL